VGVDAPCDDDELRLAGIPIMLDGTPAALARAPQLGEHNARWLKLSKDEPIA
jgi:hypothetical protein